MAYTGGSPLEDLRVFGEPKAIGWGWRQSMTLVKGPTKVSSGQTEPGKGW